MSGRKGDAELDIDEINNDAEIVMIRNRLGTFLETARNCDPAALLQKLPPYLLKERGILLVRSSRYEEGFSELIQEAQLPLLAIRVAEEAYCETKSLAILNALIKCLFASYRTGNCLRLAATMLERYYDTYSSIDLVALIPEDVEIEKIAVALKRVVENETTRENRLKIERACQEFALLELRGQLERERGKWVQLEGEERCQKCGEAIVPEASTMLYVLPDGGLKHYACGKTDAESGADNK